MRSLNCLNGWFPQRNAEMALFDAESSYVQMTESDMKLCLGASCIKLPIVLVSHCLSKVHTSQLCTSLSLGYSESTHNCPCYTTVLSRLWYCCLGLTSVYWTTSAFFSPSYPESVIAIHGYYFLFHNFSCTNHYRKMCVMNVIRMHIF